MTLSMWYFLHRQQWLLSLITSWTPPSFAMIVQPDETEAGIGGRSSGHLKLIQGARSFTHSLTTSTSISLQSNREPAQLYFNISISFLAPAPPEILAERSSNSCSLIFSTIDSEVEFYSRVLKPWFRGGGTSFYGLIKLGLFAIHTILSLETPVIILFRVIGIYTIVSLVKQYETTADCLSNKMAQCVEAQYRRETIEVNGLCSPASSRIRSFEPDPRTGECSCVYSNANKYTLNENCTKLKTLEANNASNQIKEKEEKNTHTHNATFQVTLIETFWEYHCSNGRWFLS